MMVAIAKKMQNLINHVSFIRCIHVFARDSEFVSMRIYTTTHNDNIRNKSRAVTIDSVQ